MFLFALFVSTYSSKKSRAAVMTFLAAPSPPHLKWINESHLVVQLAGPQHNNSRSCSRIHTNRACQVFLLCLLSWTPCPSLFFSSFQSVCRQASESSSLWTENHTCFLLLCLCSKLYSKERMGREEGSQNKRKKSVPREKKDMIQS
jgi:hypothetical protein